MKRLYPNQPIVGVGTVIICNGKILLGKRKNDPGKGKWSIPGGIVELGEDLEQTAIRETKEETGLEVDKPELIDVVNNVLLDEKGKIRYHFVIVDYFVKLKSGAPRAARALSDTEELQWFALDEVEKYDLTKTFREFFKRNYEKLKTLDSSSL